MTDLSDTVAPNSDQLDAIDLHMSGPRVFTVERVTKTSGEQPINIYLAEFDRPWRPGKSMRRVLIDVWGKDGTQYVGRRLKLWCDPNVQFGGQSVGGVRILEMSHIDKPKSTPLLITRGKSANYTVKPLRDAPETKARPISERVVEAFQAFSALGVTADQLEESVGKPQMEWQPDDLAELVTVYQSIQRGDVTKDEAFPPKPAEEPPGWENGAQA